MHLKASVLVPIAAIMNYHKPKRHKFIIIQFCNSEVGNGSH